MDPMKNWGLWTVVDKGMDPMKNWGTVVNKGMDPMKNKGMHPMKTPYEDWELW